MSASEQSPEGSHDVSCLELFRLFFRIGLMTFGGGFAMAAVVRHELVHNRNLLTKREFVNSLATASSVPGAIAVNMAFMEGHRLRGLPGAFAAALGTICPSVIVILMIVLYLEPYFSNPIVSAFLKGCAIGVAGQIGFATYTFARYLKPAWQNGIACAGGVTLVLLGFHPIWAVVTAAIIGYCIMHKPMMVKHDEEDEEQDEEGEERSDDA